MKRGELLRSFRGLTVTQGEGVGKQIHVFSWPREFLDQAFRHGVRDIARSIAHARIDCEHAPAFPEQKHPDLHPSTRWRIHDSANSARIADRSSKAKSRCIGSDPARAHGLTVTERARPRAAEKPDPEQETPETASESLDPGPARAAA